MTPETIILILDRPNYLAFSKKHQETFLVSMIFLKSQNLKETNMLKNTRAEKSLTFVLSALEALEDGINIFQKP